MSANRKLQLEVDKVMKKIEEGVEVFDEIWEKVYAASQQSLKEKYESDLKKEIKKLQRLRDQVKTWAGSNDIKDKTNLIDAKKLIESKMEQFKICEKETKTKAFSKEGLAREEKLDPRDIEKEKSRSWVQSIVERIETFVESWEADIERISSAKGKNKNKEMLLRLDKKVSTARWHIKMLEQINRLIDNDSLEVEKLNDIKDDIDYFVECMENDDSDGIDDDYNIYEDLQLDSISGPGRSMALSSNQADKEPESEKSKESDTSSSSSSSSSKTTATITSSGTATVGGVAIGKKTVPNNSSTASIMASISPSKTTKAATKGTTKSATKQASTTSTTTSTSSTTTANEGSTSAWANAAKPNSVTSNTSPVTSKTVAEANASTTSIASSKGVTKNSKSVTTNTTVAPASGKPPIVPESDHAPTPSPPLFDESSNQLSSGDAIPRTNTPSGINNVVGSSTKFSENNADQQQSQPAPFMQHFSSQQTTSIHQQTQPDNEMSTSSDSGNSKQQMPLFANSQEMQTISNMLKMSMNHSPPANDTPTDNRQKGFVPKNPYNAHPSFPTQQPAVFDNPAIFERLPMDSLFLAFYYQQGTYQQYLAARQLKKNSWRFHKKYMTWFQRHEEPKVTTDDYEEGTYVYFDYESGWCQRIKSEFKFEYCYLEDELTQSQNP